MHRKPAPLRVVATSNSSDGIHFDEQLVLERRIPEKNRYDDVQIYSFGILFSSSIIAAMIYNAIGKLLPLGESFNWWLFLSIEIPLSTAVTYFLFLADRGPGWASQGYKYQAFSQDLRSALASPDGQRILARAVAAKETIHGARYLSGEDAEDLNRDIKALLIVQEKRSEALENEKLDQAIALVASP